MYTIKIIFILHLYETSHSGGITVFKSKDPNSFFLKKVRATNRNIHWSVLSKKMFLEISQSSQENICARFSFLINLQAWGSHADVSYRCDRTPLGNCFCTKSGILVYSAYLFMLLFDDFCFEWCLWGQLDFSTVCQTYFQKFWNWECNIVCLKALKFEYIVDIKRI